jgi:tetratricopeptide (TPR) repeat protein
MTPAQAALATAVSFLDEIDSAIRSIGENAQKAKQERSEILNTISLATGKIQEAESLDADVTVEYDGIAFTIAGAKAFALDMEGLIHYIADEPKKALPIIEKATEIQPNAAQAWFHKGMIHASLMQKPQAIEALSKAIELSPDDIQYHRSLALVKSLSNSEISAAKLMSAGRKTFGVMKFIFLLFMILPFFMIIVGIVNKDSGSLFVGIGLLVAYGACMMAYDKVRSFFS